MTRTPGPRHDERWPRGWRSLAFDGALVLLALYTTAALRELRESIAALALTAVVLMVLSLATADVENRETSALGGAIVVGALSVGIWGLGAYAQTRRRYAREQQERLAQLERERDQLARIAVHEERASIARELHDIVAHSVSVMLVGVRGARDVMRTSPAVADDALAHVETSGEQSLAELRLRLEVTGEQRPLPGGVELSVYRIVQEALTNVLGHYRPTGVSVPLTF